MTSTFGLNKTTDSLWRVTFLNPPINLIDATMIRELRELLTTLERGGGPAVVLFDSADAGRELKEER